MSENPDLESRVSALETRLDYVAAEATTARHLAAFADRDISDLTFKVEANTKAIKALGVETAARCRELLGEVAQLRAGQTELRSAAGQLQGGMAELRVGMGQIITMLDRLVDDESH